jgi:hypothetical protein
MSCGSGICSYLHSSLGRSYSPDLRFSRADSGRGFWCRRKYSYLPLSIRQPLPASPSPSTQERILPPTPETATAVSGRTALTCAFRALTAVAVSGVGGSILSCVDGEGDAPSASNKSHSSSAQPPPQHPTTAPGVAFTVYARKARERRVCAMWAFGAGEEAILCFLDAGVPF